MKLMAPESMDLPLSSGFQVAMATMTLVIILGDFSIHIDHLPSADDLPSLASLSPVSLLYTQL